MFIIILNIFSIFDKEYFNFILHTHIMDAISCTCGSLYIPP